MKTGNRPRWQLPAGVSRSTWEYAHTAQIAAQYDSFLAFNRLFELDQEVLSHHLRRRDWSSIWVAVRGGPWCRWLAAACGG